MAKIGEMMVDTNDHNIDDFNNVFIYGIQIVKNFQGSTYDGYLPEGETLEYESGDEYYNKYWAELTKEQNDDWILIKELSDG